MPQTPNDLAAHTVISAAAVTPTPESRMVVNGKARAVKVQARMITTTNDSAIAAAMSGFGLTQLLPYQVADQLRDGRLKAILTEFEPAVLPVNLLHREGRHASPKARAFLDLAIERLRANPALT